MTEKATFNCATCKQPFEARLADRRRGWARYCSKSCKAIKQTRRMGRRYEAAYGFNSEGAFGFDNTEHQDRSRD